MTASHMAGSHEMEQVGSGSGGPGGKLAKTGGVNHKLAAGMRKLSHEHLTELHLAATTELHRRTKERVKNKSPGQMSAQEFHNWSRQLIEHEGE
jgi:hypothetical protein